VIAGIAEIWSWGPSISAIPAISRDFGD